MDTTKNQPNQSQQAIHCFVYGHVQGVFYRQSTMEQATALNLTGWVKNLNDGRVELIACGDQNNLNKLIKWLNIGPNGANVDKVEVIAVKWQAYPDFTIDY